MRRQPQLSQAHMCLRCSARSLAPFRDLQPSLPGVTQLPGLQQPRGEAVMDGRELVNRAKNTWALSPPRPSYTHTHTLSQLPLPAALAFGNSPWNIPHAHLLPTLCLRIGAYVGVVKLLLWTRAQVIAAHPSPTSASRSLLWVG